MKALSIKEPYATIIKLGFKKIETRSWKTNYRGEIYIHASSATVPKIWRKNVPLMALVDNQVKLNQRRIVAKANLVDCVLMDEEFINEIKANRNEYISGFYEVGRYAWVLEDIMPIDSNEIIKGHLGIWNV